MSVELPLQPLLQSLGTGIALVEPNTLEILFANARFRGWFGPSGVEGGHLGEWVRGIDFARLHERLGLGQPFEFEAEAREGAHIVMLSLELRQETLGGRVLLLVEVHDITRQKEAEYMLDSYAHLTETHARDLQQEKERTEKLLLSVMPRAVYEEIKDFGAATPQRFAEASVLLLDFVDFTEMTAGVDPSVVVAELNEIFSAFDRIVAAFGCERIKTSGDAYMAVSGLPEANIEHALRVARAALRMRRYIEGRSSMQTPHWRCRIGIGTGPVIGSIVGDQRYAYDVFGPAANLAARLEAVSEPMQITMGATSAGLIEREFTCRPRGREEIKGFGELELWTLVDEAGKP
jgi:class 3 adenylate cyclase